MAADRKRSAAERIGTLTVALGLGAAIACCGASVAWADEDAASSAAPTESPASVRHVSRGPRFNKSESRPPRRHSVNSDDTSARPPTPDHGRDDTADPPHSTQAPSDDEQSIQPPEAAEPDTQPSGDRVDQPTPVTNNSAHRRVPKWIHRVVTAIADGAASSDDQAPPTPIATPLLWTLLASARRDFDGPGSPPIADASPLINTSLGVELPKPELGAAATTELATVEDVPDWQDLYSGKPSFVHQVVVLGLKALEVVLKPIGGLLTLTSLRIPVFTDGIPPFRPRGMTIERTEFDGMPVWSLAPKHAGDKVVVALHGGAYVGQVSVFHWWMYTDMARNTGATVVVPLYTLAPKGTAATEVPRTADFISTMIDDHGAGNVSVLGDSAGGGLALAAVQELVHRNATTPGRLVLLAPWLDVSMSDPRSAQIDDPLLDIPNLTRAGQKWAAGPQDVANPLASPLFGSLDGLPPTYVYSSSRDLLTVDTLRLRDRVLAEDIPDVTFRLRNGLIHDYATFLFLPDARAERTNIYGDLLGTVVLQSVDQ